jgi:putative phosphoesterase
VRIIGIISDTHGLLRPEAVAALEGSALILHAGDVGNVRVLEGLREIAPVHAVRGNTDGGEVRKMLPTTTVVDLGSGRLAYLMHGDEELDLDPAAAGIALVARGHTHLPRVDRLGGVLYLNPGSAGPRRFRLPVTVARVKMEPGGLSAEIVELEVR